MKDRFLSYDGDYYVRNRLYDIYDSVNNILNADSYSSNKFKALTVIISDLIKDYRLYQGKNVKLALELVAIIGLEIDRRFIVGR